jgi:flagellar hook protein FlgE
MFTAINALNSYQFFMDVVADNLANANTIGFKTSRVTFQTQIAQLMQAGSAPSGTLGGINPTQVGLGNRLLNISSTFSQGMLQSTGRNTDMAIQGGGFFIYANGDNQFYSRDGAIEVDAEGYLVSPATGYRLQGWQAVISGSSASVDTGAPIGGIQLPLNTTLARATTIAEIGGNLDSTLEIGETYEATVGVYDSLGALHTVTLTFTRTGDSTWSWAASGDGASGSGTITFDGDGQYVSGDGEVTIPGTDGAEDTVFDLDLTNLTQLAKESDAAALNQNGLAAGNFTTFYIAPQTGEIYGVYSNGMQQLVGQVALASFVNPMGMLRVGQNMFQPGANAGEPAIGAAETGGRGAIAGGYLESSNVDLAQEFTNMILAQRGFQASSRVITTSDEMMQELVNIKR